MIDFDRAEPEWRLKYRPKNEDGLAGKWYMGSTFRGFDSRDEALEAVKLLQRHGNVIVAKLEERWCTEWKDAE